MCNFYKNSKFDDAYVLVGILEESFNGSPDELKEKLEEHIAENLELFEHTEFYKHKMSFQYEEDRLDEGTEDRLVSGRLRNERLELEMLFYGYYIGNPVAYVFGICKNDEELQVVKSVIDGAIAAAYVSRNSEFEESE